MSAGEPGTVYLLHFAQPFGAGKHQAQHYLGWAKALGPRLKHHQKGTGARLMAAVSAAGIRWQVVREWDGDKTLERRLKNQHHLPRLCPVCNPQKVSATSHASSKTSHRNAGHAPATRHQDHSHAGDTASECDDIPY